MYGGLVSYCDISDHFHFITTSTVKEEGAVKAQRFRVFNKRNINQLERLIGDVPWDNVR